MPRKIWYSQTAEVYPGIVARNNAVLEYERFIHRTYYPTTIHPYSSFRVCQLKFFIGLIPIRLTIVSVLWVILAHESYLYQIPKLLLHMINIVDVVLNFFVGYVEYDSETVVLDPKKIVIRYLFTYFIFDFIPCIPIEFFILLVDEDCIRRTNFKSYNNCHAMADFSTVSVILRLVCLFRYCYELGRILRWDYFLISMICMGFGFYTIFIFTNDFYTVLYDTKDREKWNFFDVYDDPLGEKFLRYFSAMVTLMLDCLFYDNSSPVSNMYLRCFILIITFFLSILFMAYFIKYFVVKMKGKETDRFFDLESRVVSFVKKKRLSSTLGAKTLLYFHILLENKNYGKDDEVFNYIPETFKADIFFHQCFPLLKNFYAFEDLPTYVLRRLAECMTYQLHLPNELIMRNEDDMVSMFFVQRGTVALYSVKHVELYHFEAGSSFNGKNMILGENTNNGFAISLEVLEVYRLTQNDFFEVMSTYPKLLKAVQEKFRDDRNENILD